MNILVQLFLSFFQIGLFSIGGGYAAMPLIQSQVVEIHQWLTMTQFADIITIAEMTPGPIAINSATFVGTHIAGLPGAIIATIGCVAPSCIIVLSLAYVYTKYKNLSLMKGILSGLRPVVIALIASAGLSICKLAFFNLALTAILAVGLYLLGLEDFFGFTLVVYGAGNALFVLYDVALTRLISVYYKRFRR